jgi:hypothetical protein
MKTKQILFIFLTTLLLKLFVGILFYYWYFNINLFVNSFNNILDAGRINDLYQKISENKHIFLIWYMLSYFFGILFLTGYFWIASFFEKLNFSFINIFLVLTLSKLIFIAKEIGEIIYSKMNNYTYDSYMFLKNYSIITFLKIDIPNWLIRPTSYLNLSYLFSLFAIPYLYSFFYKTKIKTSLRFFLFYSIVIVLLFDCYYLLFYFISQ